MEVYSALNKEYITEWPTLLFYQQRRSEPVGFRILIHKVAVRSPADFLRIKKEVEAQEEFYQWIRDYAVDELYVWIKEAGAAVSEID